MTPQELMDLPYYGDAEKALRRYRKWELTTTEKMRDHFNTLGDAMSKISDVRDDIEDIFA